MLILLDIDGVMVPANSWKKPEFLEDGFPAFNPVAVKALRHILAKTNASILLTTSHKTNYDTAQWLNIFASRGIVVKGLQQLNTSSLLMSRKDEILEWYKDRTPDDSYVIIDDDKMLNDLPEAVKSKLVLTSPSVGLTYELAEQAIAILYRKP